MSSKYSKVQKFYDPSYDSDEDLPEETQKEIKEKKNQFDNTGAEEVRQKGWENAGVFPKIKRFVKDKVYKDMHEKTEEQQEQLQKELARRKQLYGKK